MFYLVNINNRLYAALSFFKRMAEREGFEPPEPLGSTVFKTAAIDHSATHPSECAEMNKFFSFGKMYFSEFFFCPKTALP